MFNIVPFDAYTHCEMVRSLLFFINYYVKTLSSNESSVGCNIDLPSSLSDLYPRCSMKRYRCRASIQIILLVRATLNLKLIIRRIEARILVNLLSPIIFLSTELSYFFMNSELFEVALLPTSNRKFFYCFIQLFLYTRDPVAERLMISKS